MLSAVALSFEYGLSVLPAQAALPLSINGQEMPSLAPVVEQVTPAVVNILVSGKKVTRQEIPEQFRFFFGPDALMHRCKSNHFRRWVRVSLLMQLKAM